MLPRGSINARGIYAGKILLYNDFHVLTVHSNRKNFANVFALEAHLLSPAHTGGDSRCPFCLKMFKTTTALVQHAESASTRCKIRETVQYGQAMDIFTGGLIETQGYHQDGTIKYKAVDPNW